MYGADMICTPSSALELDLQPWKVHGICSMKCRLRNGQVSPVESTKSIRRADILIFKDRVWELSRRRTV